MTYEGAKKLLSENGQEHVLRFWDRLNDAEKASLLAQVEELDFSSIAKQKEILAANLAGTASAAGEQAPMEPAPVTVLSDSDRADIAKIGEHELKAGHVGVLLVAGGQGSRLGFDGPKGCYPVGPLTDESLFYFHARKLLALSKRYEVSVPWYIMTSRTNDADTRAFFEKNGYFGLNSKDVFFFTQGMWPALTPEGRIILDQPGHIFLGPDGHGGMLAALERSGALEDMQKRGLRTVFYFQVDNPMVDIADPAFIGFHVRSGADVSAKVCAKRDPQEGLGVIVERNRRTEIVEYTEFTDEQKNERLPDGELRYKYGSVAIHVFSVDFLVHETHAGLPIHIAHKKIPTVREDGTVEKPSTPNGYKFEKFIFDCLKDAKVCSCLAFDRTQEFSPVKNAEGKDSPASCRADLSRKWARWFADAGVTLDMDADGYPRNRIEIDPVFANTAEELAARLATGVTIDRTADILLKA